MRINAAILLSVLALAGCETISDRPSESFMASLREFKGKTESELVMNKGIPDKSYMVDHQKFIEYIYQDRRHWSGLQPQVQTRPDNRGGFTSVQAVGGQGIDLDYFCKSIFVLEKGRVVKTGATGNACN